MVPECAKPIYEELKKLLKTKSGVLDKLIEAINQDHMERERMLLKTGRNPAVKEAFAKKRAEAKFNISVRGHGSYEVIGWDNLTLKLQMREATIRQRFANGKGQFTFTAADENGIVDIYTVTRL